MSESTATHPFTWYAKQLRRELPREIFERTPSRLLWLPVNLAIIALAVGTMLLTDIHWGWRIALALVIGHTFAVQQFLAHEILHGSIIKNRTWQNICGTICMLHHCVTPTQWRAWHNKFHHGRTNRTGHDPDYFGDVAMYRGNPLIREIAKFAPGSGYARSWFFFGFWFTFQAVWILWFHSKLFNYWPPQRRRRQLWIFSAMVTFWVGVLAVVGPYHFMFIYAIPLAIANFVQLCYVTTSHLMCEETSEINDPLVNSISVTVPRWLNWFHLNVAYHTEHHVFPSMSCRHAARVSEALQEHAGPRYRRMPIWRALWLVYHTPKVHLTARELVDMRTGEVYSTLGPHGELPQQVDRVSLPVRPRRRRMRNKQAHNGAPTELSTLKKAA